MTQPLRDSAVRVRLSVAIWLGVISIVGGLLLAAADAVRGSVHWDHHSSLSAAPLFLIAGAIVAVSVGRPPPGRHVLLRLVAVLAFGAWGTAQLVPDPAVASALNDAAILLFVIDGGYVVVTEARAVLAHYGRTAQPAPQYLPAPDQADSPHGHATPGRDDTAQTCCARSAQPCTCAAGLGQR